MSEPSLSDQDIFALDRPDRKLLAYYTLFSLLLGPFFFLLLIPLAIRNRTLRYRFNDEGISMRWGGIFRREIYLTYERIQDIHLLSNGVERWLGLARIKIQTASGSAKAEMTIEGMEACEDIRDFLYARMRGAQDEGQSVALARGEGTSLGQTEVAELTASLREVAHELRLLRQKIDTDKGTSDA